MGFQRNRSLGKRNGEEGMGERAYNEVIVGDLRRSGRSVVQFSFCVKGIEAGQGQGCEVIGKRDGGG